MLDGFLCVREVHEAIFEVHAPGSPRAHAEDRLQKLGPARADETVKAEDLALPDVEAHVLQIRRVLRGEVLHGEDGVSRLVVHGREAALERAADHGGDELAHVGLRRGLRHDQLAVPQHGDLIANLKYLVHLVRDVNERNALVAQHPHHLKELVYLLNSQRGGGLVQDYDLRVVGDGLGYLAHLTLGNGHVPHGLAEVHRHAQLAEELRSLFLHPALVHDARAVRRVAAEEQVVRHAPLQALVQLLVHHGDTVFQRVLRPGEADLLAVQKDLPLVLLVGAEKTLHHRRLSGAVLAHKPHDSTALHVQIDMVKHPVPAEGLAHTAY